MPTLYSLEPDERTLHGTFSREHAPVLTIDPGDAVRYRTLDGNWGLEPYTPGSATPRREFPHHAGHALVGPVAVRGAKPGMTLAVDIGAIVPGTYGATLPGGYASAVNDRLGLSADRSLHAWTLDPQAMVGHNQQGFSVALRPFMGVMGMPPDEPGQHSTIPPRFCGGNIDCKELVSGSTLYLPIAVEGGLFSTGDGHAAQGDGEVGGTAIECPMERVDLTFRLDETLRLTTPIANTPAGWVTMGFHASLDEAAMIALDAMFELMQRFYGLKRIDAAALASVAVDLRVTQIVNRLRGVHALLPHGAIR